MYFKLNSAFTFFGVRCDGRTKAFAQFYTFTGANIVEAVKVELLRIDQMMASCIEFNFKSFMALLR